VKTLKKVNKISKFFKKNNKPAEKKNIGKSYAQASLPLMSKVLKIKETFPKLQASKIDSIYKIISSTGKLKPKLNMTIKGPLRKQVIIPMSNDNKFKFMESSSSHITNLNKALKNIKSEVIADFVYNDIASITIITNKIISLLNLQTIEKYVKNVNQINFDSVKTPQLPQSKLYLKIISLSYLLENTNTPIMSDMIKTIIKSNHIFNNIVIASKPRIIKVSPKSNIVII